MKLFNWFTRPQIQEDVFSQGRDHFRVKLTLGEVEIYAELQSGTPARVISLGSVSWARPNSQVLIEEDKKLAVEKLCEFLRRRKRTFEVVD